MVNRKESSRKYYLKNKEKIKENYKKKYEEDKEYFKKKIEKYKNENPIMFRAIRLSSAYKGIDKRKFKCENNITPKWIVENIFSKPCAHCGKEGWDVIGCNRIDNYKPHTIDNVEPCCYDCNLKLGSEYTRDLLKKQVYQYTLDGELIKVWSSVIECGMNGFNIGSISMCCNGKRKTHKGYRWSYFPL